MNLKVEMNKAENEKKTLFVCLFVNVRPGRDFGLRRKNLGLED